MARSGTYVTKQNKVEDCRQWPIHHKRSNRHKQSDISDKKNNNVSFEDLDIHYIYIKYLDTLLTL